MSEIPRRRSSRNVKLASIPLGIAGRAVTGYGRKLVGGNRSDINAELSRKAAEQLFSVLGELKGGAMKLGQALSVMEAAIPEEYGEPYREALTKLQAEAPPMPAATVHRMLDHQLGSGWRRRFAEFDDTPTASASIGQVHKAIWSDGREVAVKVQYPGADEALRADLKTLTRMSSVFAAVVPGADVKSVLAELTARTEEELDYRIEAENQRRFAKAFHGHPHFAVPKIIACSPKVVISEWLTARPVSKIIAEGTQDERNLAGTRLAEFNFSSPALAGLLHSDPHPGNFMMLPDGRLGALDFGACAAMPDGLPKTLGRMVRCLNEGDMEQLTGLMYEHSFVLPGRQVTEAEIANYLRPFAEPLLSKSFHFTRGWLRRVATPATDFTSEQFQTGRALNLPAEYLMLTRVLLGCMGIYCQLNAEIEYSSIVAKWLPGFADSAASY